MEWDRMRKHIIDGSISGWHTTVRDGQGRETVFLGGAYSENPEAAIPAILAASAKRRFEDPQPFRASQI